MYRASSQWDIAPDESDVIALQDVDIACSEVSCRMYLEVEAAIDTYALHIQMPLAVSSSNISELRNATESSDEYFATVSYQHNV